MQTEDLLEFMDNNMQTKPQPDTKNVIFLLTEVNKWKYQVSLFKKCTIPLPQHEKDIRELR
jgi:hypothetical protein